MLLVPPAGWVLALGYRSIVGSRMLDRRSGLLPAWREQLPLIAGRGLLSSAVIVGYLTPFLTAFWLLGMTGGDVAIAHPRELSLFAAGVILFPPVGIPGLPLFYARSYDWLDFSIPDIVILVTLFLITIVIMPAVFLQVARRRSFAGAFRIHEAVLLVTRAPRHYFEAWIVALAVSAFAVLLVPLTPWLLFWSYLVITHVFLQVLERATSVADGDNAQPFQMKRPRVSM